MKPIPTIDELLYKKYQQLYNETKPGQRFPLHYPLYVREVILDAIKLHVEAALASAGDVADDWGHSDTIKPEILKAYPLTNIK